MSSAFTSRRVVLATFLALPGLTACGSSPAPRLFTLAPQPSAATSPLAQTISVKRVGIPKYLDRLQIVRYRDQYELTSSEFMLWGEGLTDMITRVLVANLSARLPRSQVYAASGSLTGPSADITIEIDIDKFDPDPNGTIVLAAQWIAHRRGKNDQIHSERIEVAPASNDTPGQVAAMSEALGQLSGKIASGL
ncbi:MAG TPA: PqiC family protein [Stellaceae bacterium]|nr:PqiC family protein [Stellaceae bacterium]